MRFFSSQMPVGVRADVADGQYFTGLAGILLLI